MFIVIILYSLLGHFGLLIGNAGIKVLFFLFIIFENVLAYNFTIAGKFIIDKLLNILLGPIGGEVFNVNICFSRECTIFLINKILYIEGGTFEFLIVKVFYCWSGLFLIFKLDIAISEHVTLCVVFKFAGENIPIVLKEMLEFKKSSRRFNISDIKICFWFEFAGLSPKTYVYRLIGYDFPIHFILCQLGFLFVWKSYETKTSWFTGHEIFRQLMAYYVSIFWEAGEEKAFIYVFAEVWDEKLSIWSICCRLHGKVFHHHVHLILLLIHEGGLVKVVHYFFSFFLV